MTRRGWEVVHDVGGERVRRFPVPGGWLYQAELYSEFQHEQREGGHPAPPLSTIGMAWHPPVFVADLEYSIAEPDTVADGPLAPPPPAPTIKAGSVYIVWVGGDPSGLDLFWCDTETGHGWAKDIRYATEYADQHDADADLKTARRDAISRGTGDGLVELQVIA